jgi:hypothetical protein
MLKASLAHFVFVEGEGRQVRNQRLIAGAVRSIPIDLIRGHFSFMPKLLADEDVQRIRQSRVHAIGFIGCTDDGLWPDDVPAPSVGPSALQ